MIIVQSIGFILLALLLMSMLATVRPWRRAVVPGKVLQTLPAGFLARLLLHRSSLLALATGLVFGMLAGWLPIHIALTVAAFAVLIVLMPMRYTFTTKGVAVGDTLFRPWSEFSGINPGKSSLELAHPSYFGRLTLFIKPAEMGSVLKHIERHVQAQSSNS